MVEETQRQIAVTSSLRKCIFSGEQGSDTFGAASSPLLLVMARKIAGSHLHVTRFTHHPLVRNICIQWEHMCVRTYVYLKVYFSVWLWVTKTIWSKMYLLEGNANKGAEKTLKKNLCQRHPRMASQRHLLKLACLATNPRLCLSCITMPLWPPTDH